jgi:glycosyltransferase involved in cell wall biosynthesis
MPALVGIQLAETPEVERAHRVDVSVIICTHNRARLVQAALTHLFAQQLGALRVEIIIVDNNSTDNTAEVVRPFLYSAPVETRYRFEAAQGISYARNTGWRMARGTIVAFTDDDVKVAPDWVARIAAAFAQNGDVDCVGGKVLPEWPVPPPGWLTRDHWAPLAILDYGDAAVSLGHHDSRCLIGANFAFRRAALERIGGFSPDVQRVKDGIGSIEDHECLIRLWNGGGRALYVPEIVVVAPVDLPRLRKRYHRKWHSGHGHFHAVMRSPDIERSTKGRLLDVPAHLYRQCLEDATSWVRASIRGNADAAFVFEKRLRFFWGFFRTRVGQTLNQRIGRRRTADLAAAPPRISGRAGTC